MSYSLQQTALSAGDFLLTRNREGPGEYGNPTPGYWNHVSVAVSDSQIIEAQVEPYNKVILSEWSEFYYRYPEIAILRPPAAYANSIASMAKSLVGRPYRKVVLFFTRRSKVGENCVSVARKAWMYAAHFDPGWRIPDDLYQETVDGYLRLAGIKRSL